MAGRKRKPTHEHERNGSFAKNPKRGKDRENEPTDLKPIGKPPAGVGLTHKMRAAWNEIVSQSHPGTLSSADRHLVEMAARTLVEIREGNASASMLLRFQTFLTEMGMTPASRSKVSVAPVKDEGTDFGSL